MKASIVEYRKGTINDLLDVRILLEEYCIEINQSYDINSLMFYIVPQLENMDNIVALIDNKIVGIISFMVTCSPFYEEEIIAKKYGILVSKEYRDLGIGKELLKKAEEISKQLGAVKFYYTSTKQPTGYKQLEIEWEKEL